MIVPSADISEFNILTTVDLSGATPTICLQADSVGPNEALVEYIYKITTPSGAIVWEGSFTSPDATGNADVFCKDLPEFNHAIEWSGGDFAVVATMRDTAALEFSQTISIQICPPRGNNIAGTNYGAVRIAPQVKCDAGQLLLSDSSNYDYKGYVKTLVSKTWTLILPADPDTGIQPSPIVITGGFNDVLFDINYSGAYEARLVTIYSYAIATGQTLIIKYTSYNQNTGVHLPVAVECNIDLCPLLCEYEEFLAETEMLCGKNEVKYTNNQRILSLINSKILAVNMRKSCGKPVGELIAEIKRISGFKCNCDCGNNGIVPRSLIPTAAASYVFACATSCGDVAGTFTNPSGNNILLTLNDKTYSIGITPGAITYGLSKTEATVGCNKTTTIDLNITTLTDSILTEIGTSDPFKAALCALVALCDPFNIFAGVDMKCIYPALGNTCDYYGDLNQPQNPLDTFKGVEVNGVWYYPSTTWVYSNSVQINLWLQTLGFGFGATDYIIGGSGNVALTALANANNITRLAFTNVSTTNIYEINVVPSNCTTVTSTDKMQGIVDKICQLYNDMYGVSPVLYKVKADSTTAPGYLFDVLISSDGSISKTMLGNYVNLTTFTKVNAADNCKGYLINKIKSDKLVVTNELVPTVAYDYIITIAAIGPTRYIANIIIGGVTYLTGGILTTDLVGLETFFNSLGLGTFTCTSPASNLVITSLGNIYVITSVSNLNTVGPSFIIENAVQSNPQSVGSCAKVNIDPLARTWGSLTLDTAIFNGAVNEISSVDSLGNVMINLSALPVSPPIVVGTYSYLTVAIPVAQRPRTNQFVEMWSGWDGISANARNYFEIKTDGFIDVIINVEMATERMLINSFYYPTN
jgi:hypothetical protein